MSDAHVKNICMIDQTCRKLQCIRRITGNIFQP